MTDKSALRRAVRAAHQGREARAAQSEAICRAILASDEYRRARVVAAYVPLRWEADITPVLLDVLSTGRTLALPLCEAAPRMTLRRVTSLDELVPGAYGIPEPPRTADVIAPADADLLLIPLEAIDPTGMRLGKGGGYYDHLLAGADVPHMGCALSWQACESVPADVWDRPLRACAFPGGVTHYSPDRMK